MVCLGYLIYGCDWCCCQNQPKMTDRNDIRILEHVVGITVENEVKNNLPEPVRITFHHDVISVSTCVCVRMPKCSKGVKPQLQCNNYVFGLKLCASFSSALIVLRCKEQGNHFNQPSASSSDWYGDSHVCQCVTFCLSFPKESFSVHFVDLPGSTVHTSTYRCKFLLWFWSAVVDATVLRLT